MAKRATGGESRREASRRKEKYWQGIFKQQKASGISHSDFCRKKSLPPNSYFWWKRELKIRLAKRRSQRGSGASSRAKRQPAASLVPVQVLEQPFEPNSAGEAFEIVLGRDRMVRVPGKFDPESLKRLLSILEERC